MPNLMEKLAGGLATIKNPEAFKKAPEVIRKAPSALKARALEFLAGGAVGAPIGGTVGYKGTKNKENKKKNALKGALIGGLAGGAGAVRLNRLALNKLRSADADISKHYSNINSEFAKGKASAQKFHDTHSAFNSDSGTEKFYDKIYKKRKASREAGADEIKNQAKQRRESAENDLNFWKTERREKILNDLKDYKKQKAEGNTEFAGYARRRWARNKPYDFYTAGMAKARKNIKDSGRFRMHDAKTKDYKTLSPGWEIKRKIKMSRLGNFNDIFKDIFNTDAEDRIANRLTNKENLKRFKDKYIDNTDIKDITHDSIYDKQKSSFFGGFRGKKDLEKAKTKVSEHLKRVGDYKDDIGNKDYASLGRRWARAAFGDSAGENESVSFLEGDHFITPEDMKKTKEYTDHISNIKKNVAKDIRKGKQGDFFEGYQKAKDNTTKSSFSDGDKAEFGDIFGRSFDSVKSKKDFKKMHREAAKKYHPDVYKGPDKMSKINDFIKKFKNSDHYDKLAMIDFYKDQIEKVAYRN